jgi:hypothetical protein
MKYSAQRDQRVRRVILIEGSANLLVLILKTIAGLSAVSMAILTDAMRMPMLSTPKASNTVRSGGELVLNCSGWLRLYYKQD